MENTVGQLAKLCGVSVKDLCEPIKRITKFEYDTILPDLVDTDSPTFRRKDILFLAKQLESSSLSLEEKEKIEVNPTLFGFVLEQGAEAKDLVSINEIADQNNLKRSVVSAIVRDWLKTKRYILNDFLVTNIFKSTRHHFIDAKKVNTFAQLILIELAVRNRAQVKRVPTNNVAYTTHSKFIWVTLLEQVQDANSTKGRVIGFAKNAKDIFTPIVRWYNGSISFAESLQHSPRSSGRLNFKSLSPFKRIASFIFPLSEITNAKSKKRNVQLFNIFLRSMQNRPLEISVSLKGNIRSNEGRILIKTNPLYLNVAGLDFNDDDPSGIKIEKLKAYGKHGATNEEMADFLNRFADKNTRTHVFYNPKSSNPLFMTSKSYRIVAYLRDRSTFDLLKNRASVAGQTLGEYLRTLADLNATETQLSVYERDFEAHKLTELENMEKRIGKHLIYKHNVQEKDLSAEKSKAKNYLLSHQIPDKIVKVILDDPLTVNKIASKLVKNKN